MEQNIFWDIKLTLKEAKKILGDREHDRFSEIAAVLLSRTNNLKWVFSKVLSKEVFCREWRRIKSEMRKNKWADERIDFWEQIHQTVYGQIGRKMLAEKKQKRIQTSEFSEVAEILRTERKKQGITQGMLAQRTEISQQTISHVENGIGDVSFGTLKRISNALNLQFQIFAAGKH